MSEQKGSSNMLLWFFVISLLWMNAANGCRVSMVEDDVRELKQGQQAEKGSP